MTDTKRKTTLPPDVIAKLNSGSTAEAAAMLMAQSRLSVVAALAAIKEWRSAQAAKIGARQ